MRSNVTGQMDAQSLMAGAFVVHFVVLKWLYL